MTKKIDSFDAWKTSRIALFESKLTAMIARAGDENYLDVPESIDEDLLDLHDEFLLLKEMIA